MRAVLARALATKHPKRALGLWMAAAAHGDAEAAFCAGEAVLHGLGAVNDAAQAARWYSLAAQAGHVRAQVRLAQLHLGGYSAVALRPAGLFTRTEPHDADFAAALPWAREAAAAGDAEALTLLGQILCHGPEALRDKQAGRSAYAKAAALGYAPARLGLALQLLPDWTAALEHLQHAADLPTARYLLGLGAELGLGQTADLGSARLHYESAAKGGIVPAQARLGRLLLDNADTLNGETWLRRAARAGDAGAATLVGLLESVEAAQWFQMSAEAGDAAGAFNYALCLAHGRGVPRDHAEAFAWLARAARTGLVPAMSALASAYADGRGVKRDVRRARLWLRRAAKAGEVEAMFALGVFYAETSPHDALHWLQEAAARGHALAPVVLAQFSGTA